MAPIGEGGKRADLLREPAGSTGKFACLDGTVSRCCCPASMECAMCRQSAAAVIARMQSTFSSAVPAHRKSASHLLATMKQFLEPFSGLRLGLSSVTLHPRRLRAAISVPRSGLPSFCSKHLRICEYGSTMRKQLSHLCGSSASFNKRICPSVVAKPLGTALQTKDSSILDNPSRVRKDCSSSGPRISYQPFSVLSGLERILSTGTTTEPAVFKKSAPRLRVKARNLNNTN